MRINAIDMETLQADAAAQDIKVLNADQLPLGYARRKRLIADLLSGYFYFLSGFSPEDAPDRTPFPSLIETLTAFTRFEPSLERKPLTVTSSPIFSEDLVQPARAIHSGCRAQTPNLSPCRTHPLHPNKIGRAGSSIPAWSRNR